jgi:hypothetical protein
VVPLAQAQCILAHIQPLQQLLLVHGVTLPTQPPLPITLSPAHAPTQPPFHPPYPPTHRLCHQVAPASSVCTWRACWWSRGMR